MADGGHPIITVDAPPEGVRIGTPADVDGVMELALMGCAENAAVPHDPELVLGDVWAALNLEHGIVGVIGPPGQTLEAGVLLRMGTIWYSRQVTVEERAVFIHPQYRAAKGGRATKLIKFSKWVADQFGVPLTIGVLSSHRTEAKVRAYRRHLGEPAGAYWVYYPPTYHGENLIKRNKVLEK